MLKARSALAGCVLHNTVYAIGGQSRTDTHCCMEALDLPSGRWLPVAREMSTARKYAAAVVMDERVVVLGGMDGARQRTATVEVGLGAFYAGLAWHLSMPGVHGGQILMCGGFFATFVMVYCRLRMV